MYTYVCDALSEECEAGFFYANSEPQPDAKDSCAVSIEMAIAR